MHSGVLIDKKLHGENNFVFDLVNCYGIHVETDLISTNFFWPHTQSSNYFYTEKQCDN